jgi:aspartate/methionine/tyrosine aminotransferase
VKIEPFKLERWLLEKCEIDLGGGGVSKLQLRDVLSGLDGATYMRYGRTDGSDTIRRLVAEWHDVEPDNVLITSGTSEANLLVNLCLVEAEDEYVTEYPQYEQTPGFVKMLGARVKAFHLVEAEGWAPDIEELKGRVTSDTKVIFLDNPNNPTGALLSEEEMKGICDVAEDVNAWVHCDNALRGSELDGEPSATPLNVYERGIVTGSISKLGATSPRIGWVVAEKEFIDRCSVMKDYTTLSHCGIGEQIAERLLRNRDRYIKRNLTISKANIAAFNKWVEESPDLVSCVPPRGGFTAFPKYRSRLGSKRFCERLLREEGVMLSPGDHFGVDKHFRINLGTKGGTFAEGLRRIETFMKKIP